MKRARHQCIGWKPLLKHGPEQRAQMGLMIGWLSLVAGISPVLRAEEHAAQAMRILKTNCLSCHNDTKHKGGLTLASREAMLKGGSEGAVFMPDQPAASPLVKSLVEGADPHMPPKKQLSAEHIQVLTNWVNGGAHWDAEALAGPASAPRAVALAPLPTSYRPVLALSISPDGKWLAAACRNELVTFAVQPKSLVFRARASAHLDAIQSIAWSPDGKRILTGAFRRVIVWNAETLVQEREITSGLSDRIAALKFMPDGATAFLADGLVGESGLIRVLNLSTNQLTLSWSAHADTIFAIALSPDGKLLATAGGDNFVKFWDPSTGKESARIEAHSTQVLGLAFSPDGTQLVTGGADRQLKVWDVKTRENIIALAHKKSAFNATQWNSVGPTVYTITEEGEMLRYTDLKSHTGAQSSESGKEHRMGLTPAGLYCLAATSNGERVFAGSSEGRIVGWDKDGTQVDNVDVPSAQPAP